MLFLIVLALCLATVPLAGGRLMALTEVELRGAPLMLAALGVQVLILAVLPDLPDAVAKALHGLSYVLAGAFLWANRRIPGLPLLALGACLNFVAIAANGGVMPASADALATAGVAHEAGEFTNSAAVADPRLGFLGDVFAVPAGWPGANVFSVGDVAILAGALWGVHRLCGSRLGRLVPPRPLAPARGR